MKRVQKDDLSELSTKERAASVPSPRPVRAADHGDRQQKVLRLAGQSLFLLAFVGIAIYGIAYTWSWSLSTSKAQTETFTELYFGDYLHLPSEVLPGHLYAFQFTLHNLEGKNMTYSYEVYNQIGKETAIFDRGTIFLKENDYITIQEKFITTHVLPESEIVVDLINKHQQIDFWIDGKV